MMGPSSRKDGPIIIVPFLADPVYPAVAVDRWLDKLGLAAKMGVDVVIRQSFFHGHYALLDDDMHPRPV